MDEGPDADGLQGTAWRRSVREKASWQSVAAMPPLDMTHFPGPESSPLEGNDLLAPVLPPV